MQIAVATGLDRGGGFSAGCERLGALAIPVGPGNVDMHCEFLGIYKARALLHGLHGTAHAEEVHKRGIIDRST